MIDPTARDRLQERIDQLGVAMRAVECTLRLLSYIPPEVGEDMSETLHLLACVLDHPEVVG